MLDEIKEIKLKKLENLRAAGMEAYPEKTGRSIVSREALAKFEALAEKEIVLAGRVRSLRPMGGSAFAHIEDESGKIQIFLNEQNLSASPDRSAESRRAGGSSGKYKLFIDNVDLGDFIEARGKLFKTQTQEMTLQVADWKMLAKSLAPVPTEHFGLKDTEELLRRRYLDLMMNPETRELFRQKNIFWQTLRNLLAKKGFLEVQTPVFENVPGGADAEPFVTRHNALARDYFMRISLELPLKKMLVGGYEKIFEIGRVFRNEGIDREHLQEYDMVEIYSVYTSLKDGMKLTKKIFQEIAKKIGGKTQTQIQTGNPESKIDWLGKWETKDYFKAFKEETGIDLGKDVFIEDLKKKADELKVEYKPEYGKGRMIDLLFKKLIRPKMIQPTFLVGHPVEVSPLAKKDPKNLKKVLRLQVIAGGMELANGFSELNDPIDQRSRFEEQMKLREAGDKEAQMLDEDFVEALEYGMPPAFGLGISERLFAFLTGKSVRETVIFPPMKEK